MKYHSKHIVKHFAIFQVSCFYQHISGENCEKIFEEIKILDKTVMSMTLEK